MKLFNNASFPLRLHGNQHFDAFEAESKLTSYFLGTFSWILELNGPKIDLRRNFKAYHGVNNLPIIDPKVSKEA